MVCKKSRDDPAALPPWAPPGDWQPAQTRTPANKQRINRFISFLLKNARIGENRDAIDINLMYFNNKSKIFIRNYRIILSEIVFLYDSTLIDYAN
jgi:hypothetical protein